MKRRETKGAILALCLAIAIVTIAAFMWTTGARDAVAFPGAADAAGSCTSCHSFTTSTTGPEHAAHLGRGAVCADCHGAAFNPNPPTSACGECHAVPGIAQFHSTVGVTVCVGCHQVPTTETVCDDDVDNDNDGATDCADADCAEAPACAPGVEICNDGTDNDGDSLIDCADPNCAAFPACVPTETNCNNGTDDDGDGAIDCADTDCAGNPVCAPSGPPADHTDIVKGVNHKPGKENPTKTNCTTCHGADLKGGIVGVSCFTCHGQVWAQGGRVPVSHTKQERGVKHKPGLNDPFANKCTDCHGADLRGSSFAPSCYKCHGAKWDRGGRDGYGDRDGRDGGDRDGRDGGDRDGRDGGDRNGRDGGGSYGGRR